MQFIDPPRIDLGDLLEAVLQWSPLPPGVASREEALRSVMEESALFRSALVSDSLHTLRAKHGEIPSAVRNLYGSQLAKKTGRGWSYYSNIRLLARSGRCPYCRISTADTLDHNLSKAKFPLLSLDPMNLVPCCSSCNRYLGFKAPTTPEECKPHPYVGLPEGTWLHARAFEGSTGEISFEFYCDPPAVWPVHQRDRMSRFFDKLRLARLYAAYSGHISSRIEGHASRHGGLEKIVDLLAEFEEVDRGSDPNHVDAACYGAVLSLLRERNLQTSA